MVTWFIPAALWVARAGFMVVMALPLFKATAFLFTLLPSAAPIERPELDQRVAAMRREFPLAPQRLIAKLVVQEWKLEQYKAHRERILQGLRELGWFLAGWVLCAAALFVILYYPEGPMRLAEFLAHAMGA